MSGCDSAPNCVGAAATGREFAKLPGDNKVQTTAGYAHFANNPLNAAAKRIARGTAAVAPDGRALTFGEGSGQRTPSRRGQHLRSCYAEPHGAVFAFTPPRYRFGRNFRP